MKLFGQHFQLSPSHLAIFPYYSTNSQAEFTMSNIFSLRIILLQAGLFLSVLAANPAPLNARCPDNTIVDTIFVLENNPASGADNWSKMLQFFLDVIGQFKLGEGNARFGICNFNSNYAGVINLMNLSTVISIDQFLRPKTDLNLLTYTDRAFTNIKDLNMFGSNTGGRQSARRKIVLITDGKSSDLQKTLSLATALKSSGIQIITIGIGNGVQLEELQSIASTNLDTYSVSSYDQLADYRTTVINKICYATPTPLNARCPVNTIVDTIFVLENNPVSGADNWSKEFQFFLDVIGQFRLGEGNARFGISNLQGNYAGVIDLIFLNTVAAIDQFLRPRKDLNLLTYRDKAFSNIKYLNMFGSSTGGRQSARRKIVLITDGKSLDLQNTLNMAYSLKSSGIHIITIGIGNGVQKDELLAIASTNIDTYFVSSYDQLADYRTLLINKICYENTPIFTATVATTTVTTTAPATTAPLTVRCPDNTIEDTIFVLENNPPSGADSWSKMLQFILDVMGQFKLGERYARFGIPNLSGNYARVIDLSNTNSLADIDKFIRPRTDLNLLTYTDKAFSNIKDLNMFGSNTGGRQSARRKIVLITDGKSSDLQKTLSLATDLKSSGIHIITIGIGNGVHKDELQAIASTNLDTYFVSTYDQLTDYRTPLIKKICYENTPIITTTVATTTVTTTVSAALKCTVKTPIDVVFVLQYSDNRADNWNKLVQFVVDTVGRFNLGPNDARFGSLSSKVKDPTSFDVCIYSDYAAIEKGFKGNGERKNGNFTDKALTAVSQWIVNGQASHNRTQAKTYMVLATDGKSGNLAETQKAVDLLKKQNVRLVTVGVGSGISSTELKTLASSTDDAILATTFDDLPNLRNPLFNRLCRAN